MDNEVALLRQKVAELDQKLQNQCDKCNYKSKDLGEKLQETKDIVESMRALNISVTKLTEQIKYNSAEVADMKLQIANVTNKPAERWDKLIVAIITALTSGIISTAISLLL